jgi:hypothetical protein
VAGLRPAIVLFFIVTFGFAARATTLRTPIFDHHSWRQADTAAIARNFVRERFNPIHRLTGAAVAQPATSKQGSSSRRC